MYIKKKVVRLGVCLLPILVIILIMTHILSVNITMNTEGNQNIQIYYTVDSGYEFNEKNKVYSQEVFDSKLQQVKLNIIDNHIVGKMRIDFTHQEKEIVIYSIQFKKGFKSIKLLPNQIKELFLITNDLNIDIDENENIKIKTTGIDPYIIMTERTVDDLLSESGTDYRVLLIYTFIVIILLIAVLLWKKLMVFFASIMKILKGIISQISGRFKFIIDMIYEIEEYLSKNQILIIAAGIIMVLSFGFEIFNYTLSIDEEVYLNNYLPVEVWIKQARYGMYLFGQLIPSIIGPFRSILSIGLIALSSLLWIWTLSKDNISKASKITNIIFILLYVSYPTHAYFVQFNVYSVEVALAMCMIPLSIVIMEKYIKEKKLQYLITSTLMVAFNISCYQVFVGVYAMGVASYYLIKIVDNVKNNKVINQIIYIKDIFAHILNLILAIVVYFMGNSIFKIICPSSGYIEQFSDNIGLNQIISGIGSVINIWKGKSIPGGGIISVTIIAFIVTIIVLCTIYKKNRAIIFVVGISVLVLPFAEGIVLGILANRTLQGVPLMIGVAWLLIMGLVKGFGKKCIAIILIFVALNQAQYMNYTFLSDNLRYEQDIAIGHRIMSDILDETDGDLQNKTIIFIGIPRVVQGSYIKNDTIGASFFEWDGGNPRRIEAFLRKLGYDVQLGDKDQIRDFEETIRYMSQWPVKGSIKTIDDLVIINFSSSN